jgi:hypothetical protein
MIAFTAKAVKAEVNYGMGAGNQNRRTDRLLEKGPSHSFYWLGCFILAVEPIDAITNGAGTDQW